MIKNTIINLSDDKIFYTVEGEGKYVGTPSVFMRMSGCNLTCQGFKSKDSPHGCDSYVSWSVYNKYTVEELLELFETKAQNSLSYVNALRRGAILKLTGGEPLLQQARLLEFIDAFIVKYKFLPRIDFETNGTIMPDSRWHEELGATYTVSPKLSNNGDPFKKRFKDTVLQWHADNVSNSNFKFVVQNESDVNEVIGEYVAKFEIPYHDVYLMPCAGSRKELQEVSAQVVEWCKEYGFNFSNRMHLQIWDKALKV